MIDLGLAELRALLYIFRRTFGFKKFSDDISINQMLEGIVTRDGRRLDYGTGLSKKSLLPALRSLEKKGHIITNRNRSTRRGNESTTYRLNIRNVPTLGEESSPRARGSKYTKARGSKYTTQDTDEQDTVKQETDLNSNRKFLKKEEKRGGGFKSIASLIQQTSVIAVKTSPSLVEETNPPQADQTTIRDKATPPKPPQTSYKPYGNEKLIETIQAISNEFGDTKHLKENIGQVHNIYKIIKKKGLSDTDLVDMMYRVRGITREKEGTFSTSRMAYFFRVFRQEYGIDQPPP